MPRYDFLRGCPSSHDPLTRLSSLLHPEADVESTPIFLMISYFISVMAQVSFKNGCPDCIKTGFAKLPRLPAISPARWESQENGNGSIKA